MVSSGVAQWVPDCLDLHLAWQILLLGQKDPSKTGMDPDLGRPGPMQAGVRNSGQIFALFWVRVLQKCARRPRWEALF